MNDRTRVLLLNTPNNPTGSAIGVEEWQEIATLCERHDVTLICDEVWEAMVFGGTSRLAAVDPGVARPDRQGSDRRARSSR